MRQEKNQGASPDREDESTDRRERFVLHAWGEVADAVPTEPEDRIDVEEVLRHLDGPERSRTRARRHSAL
jgi:hypothetical protein